MCIRSTWYFENAVFTVFTRPTSRGRIGASRRNADAEEVASAGELLGDFVGVGEAECVGVALGL